MTVFCRAPTPVQRNEGEPGALKFHWTNYTEYNQDYAVLSLKSHLDKFFLTDRCFLYFFFHILIALSLIDDCGLRMLFWNFFFPIFRDYPFRLESDKDCGDWAQLKERWVVWLLAGLCATLLLLLIFLIICKLRNRSSKDNHHHPPNTNNLPLMAR
jgi:hypothetical protein